jgi:hypothetical protein
MSVLLGEGGMGEEGMDRQECLSYRGRRDGEEEMDRQE